MIRQLDTSVPDLARIHAQCFDHGWSDGVFAELCAKPHHRVYVLETDGGVASFIALAVVAGEGEILTLATDPARQNNGLARQLLTFVIEDLRLEGAEALFLEVATDNPAALALYARLGFTQAGVRKAYYGRRNGPPVDGHILRLALV